MKTAKYKNFKIKEIFDLEKSYEITNIVDDFKFDNGVTGTNMAFKIFDGDCITFSLTGNGNVFYQNKKFQAHSTSLIVLKEHELNVVRNMKMGEEVGLYYVTILKKCCENRSLGRDEYSPETIANWEIGLPVNRFGFVDYPYIIDYMNGVMKKVAANIGGTKCVTMAQ